MGAEHSLLPESPPDSPMRKLLNGYFSDWQGRMMKDNAYQERELQRMRKLDGSWMSLSWIELAAQADHVTSKLMDEHPEYVDQYIKEDIEAIYKHRGLSINSTSVANAARAFWVKGDKLGWQCFMAKVHAGVWPVTGLDE